MNSEIILETFEKRLLMQRYAGNTIRSYKDYASIFLKHVSKYPSLEEIPLSDIEAFINEKVQNGKISVSYQKGLVGAIKKMYELLNLKIKDIKSSDGIIRIHQRKGNKDRIVSLPDKLLATLRHYYQAFKPKEYLFEGEKGGKYSERSVQLILKKALVKANVRSEGSVHTL